MIEISRILCPVDFSEASRHAVAHAVGVARWYGSALTALHVGNPMLLVDSPFVFPDNPDRMPLVMTNRSELEGQVQDWLHSAKATGLETRVIIEQGNAVSCILEYAASLSANLIVMGTHGRGGFERLVLGSVTEKVLRKATCPVMTVPPPAVGASKLPFAHLLCPVDFSDSSATALQFAFSLAQESNARLTLLNVFEWPDAASAREVLQSSEFHQKWQLEAQQQLEALIPSDARNWCVPETRLAVGRAYQEIQRIAASEQVDLIVMGVRGHNALDRLLFGSTTSHVVRQASCPVLTVRS